MKNFLCFCFVFSFIALSGCHNTTTKSDGSLIIPENTEVIIHFSSQVDPRISTPSEAKRQSFSHIFYYDNLGNLKGDFSINDEIISDFIVQNQDSVSYFFKNESFLATHDSIISAPSNLSINTTQFGPKEIGYIDSLNLFFAYFNMGGSTDGTYRMVLRLFSETENYDVIIPYYAPSICFDESNQRFICEISSTDKYGDKDFFRYIIVPFDKNQKKFKLEKSIYSIPYKSDIYNDDFFLGAGILCSDDKIYRVAAIQNFTTDKMQLLLSEINLTTQSIQHSIIKDDYSSSSLGHPYIIGSADTPISVHNNTLYVFTSDFHLVTINQHGEVLERNFPYSFSNLRSRRNPDSTSLLDPSDNFFNSLISVEDNGDIYVLNVDQSATIQIFKYNENDSFNLVWETNLPDLDRSDLMINTFELIF